MQQAPASIICLAIKYVASSLPKPASISAMIGTIWVWKLSILDCIFCLSVSSALSNSLNNPPNSLASACLRKVYSSEINDATDVFSCID